MDQRLARRHHNCDQAVTGGGLRVIGEHANVVGVADGGNSYPRLGQDLLQTAHGVHEHDRAEPALSIHIEKGLPGPSPGTPRTAICQSFFEAREKERQPLQAVRWQPAQLGLDQEIGLKRRGFRCRSAALDQACRQPAELIGHDFHSHILYRIIYDIVFDMRYLICNK